MYNHPILSPCFITLYPHMISAPCIINLYVHCIRTLYYHSGSGLLYHHSVLHPPWFNPMYYLPVSATCSINLYYHQPVLSPHILPYLRTLYYHFVSTSMYYQPQSALSITLLYHQPCIRTSIKITWQCVNPQYWYQRMNSLDAGSIPGRFSINWT